MCDHCFVLPQIANNGGLWVIDPNNDQQMIKCQPNNSAAHRELYMYYHLKHSNILPIQDVKIINQKSDHRTGEKGTEYIHFTAKRCLPLTKHCVPLTKLKLSRKAKRKIFLDLVDTVAYLQSRQVHHQQILPKNIMLDDNMTPYLVNFDMCGSNNISRSYWNSPEIHESPFFHPTTEELLRGDSWSLGLLGLYLFADLDPYQFDSFKSDEKRKDYYPEILRGYFLHLKKVETNKIPSDIWRVIQTLLNGQMVTTHYQPDPIVPISDNYLRETVMLYYNPSTLLIASFVNQISVNHLSNYWENYLENLKELPTATKLEVIKLIGTCLDLNQSIQGRENKVKLVCFIYDYCLPLAYDKICTTESDLRFWEAAKKKLLELSAENSEELQKAITRRLPEIERVIEIIKCQLEEHTEKHRSENTGIAVVPMEVPNKFRSLEYNFVIVRGAPVSSPTVVGILDYPTSEMRLLTDSEKNKAKSLGLQVLQGV